MRTSQNTADRKSPLSHPRGGEPERRCWVSMVMGKDRVAQAKGKGGRGIHRSATEWVLESPANEHWVNVEFWEEMAAARTHSLMGNHLL